MKFIYNLFESIKRNWFFNIVMVVMISVSLYIGAEAIYYYSSYNDIFEYCRYNEDFSDDYVLQGLWSSENYEDDEFDKALLDSELKDMGYSAEYNLNLPKRSINNYGDTSRGFMITPYATEALQPKCEGGYFTPGYVGDGSQNYPYEIIIRAEFKNAEYKINQVYQMKNQYFKENGDTVEEPVNVKVVGYIPKGGYGVNLDSNTFYEWMFLSDDFCDYMICGYPQRNINKTIIVDGKYSAEHYIEKYDILFEDRVKNLKDMYDADYSKVTSTNVKNIMIMVMLILVIISGMIANVLYRIDALTKFNAVKRLVGARENSTAFIEVLSVLLVFILGFLLIFAVGSIWPAKFSRTEVFPTIGFWISTGVVGGLYFGAMIISLVLQLKVKMLSVIRKRG